MIRLYFVAVLFEDILDMCHHLSSRGQCFVVFQAVQRREANHRQQETNKVFINIHRDHIYRWQVRRLCGNISPTHHVCSCSLSVFQVFNLSSQSWHQTSEMSAVMLRKRATCLKTDNLSSHCLPRVLSAEHSHWNVTANSKRRTGPDIVSQKSPTDEPWSMPFCVYPPPLCFISTVEWRAGGKHKAKPTQPNYWRQTEAIWVFSSFLHPGQNVFLRQDSGGKTTGFSVHTINFIKHTVHVCECLINNNVNNNILTKGFAYIRPGSNCISNSCGSP